MAVGTATQEEAVVVAVVVQGETHPVEPVGERVGVVREGPEVPTRSRRPAPTEMVAAAETAVPVDMAPGTGFCRMRPTRQTQTMGMVPQPGRAWIDFSTPLIPITICTAWGKMGRRCYR